VEVRFRIPRLPAGALSNVVGLAGLLAIALAVGALAGSAWWSVLSGGVFAVALAALAQMAEQPAAVPVAATAGPRPVPRAASE
jgi:hypothetical protein